MVDRSIPWFRVNLGSDEVSRMEESVRSRRITMGPVTAELERRIAQFLDVSEVVMVNSGASALFAALKACGVGPGDEVIVPGLSFIATAHAVQLVGAQVRLVDVLPTLPLIDPDAVEAAVTDRTRAIVPVHLGGRSVDMDRIHGIAHRHGLKVVEDAAQAFGSRNLHGWLGTQSDVGCFSMGITKLVTTGEGGCLVARDHEALVATKYLRNNGMESLSENRFDRFGFNLRPTDVLCAMGLARMDGLEKRMESLRELYRFYRDALSGLRFIRLIEVEEANGELPLWIEAVCAQRERVVRELANRGIQAKPFPPSLCDSLHLKCESPLDRSRFFARSGLVLPCGPDQPVGDLERVVQALTDIGTAIDEEAP